MSNRDMLAALLVTALYFCLSSTEALAQNLLDERANLVVDAGPQLTRTTNNVYGIPLGRLLQRHEKRSKKNDEKTQVKENSGAEEGEEGALAIEHDARQLGKDDDETNTNLSFEFNSLTCRVVAVDAFRRLSSNSSAFDYYPDSDAVVPFATPSQVDTDEGFLCEMPSGAFAAIKGTDEQFTELRTMLSRGTLISALSSIEVEMESALTSSSVEGVESSSPTTVATLPSGEIQLIDNTEDVGSRRRLGGNYFVGDKKILLVRVTDVDGRAVSSSARTISDKFFGTYGDTMTVTSGFEDCSYGNLKMTYDYGTAEYDSKLSAPGVVDVQIGIKLTTSPQASIIQAAAVAAMEKMNVGLPGPFAHVIFILEECYTSDDECNFAAYGYVNHWLIATIGNNWMYPAVVMHEMGHNMNMGHSGGMDGATYTDHTCLMGNPLFSDDVGRMCFNPVKNFQIAKGSGGWYTADTDIAYFNSGTAGGTSWSGRLIGVADYGNNPNKYPIMVKIEVGGASDYFVSFNRARGINSEVQQAHDQVVIYQVDSGDGKTYSKSMMKAALRGGRQATIENWRKSGKDLTIKVIMINTSSSPGYAEISILFGPQITTSEISMVSETSALTTSILSTVIFDSGTTESKRWTGSIAALNESSGRVSSNNNYPVAVRLYTGDASEWYIEYKDGDVFLDKVLFSGDGYNKSTLKPGQPETISNWRNSGYDLVIVVKDISDEYASIEITFGA